MLNCFLVQMLRSTFVVALELAAVALPGMTLRYLEVEFRDLRAKEGFAVAYDAGGENALSAVLAAYPLTPQAPSELCRTLPA